MRCGYPLSAAERHRAVREVDRMKRAQKYTKRFGQDNQRAWLRANQLSIRVLKPGVYSVSSDSVDKGVQDQIMNLLSRLKKRISINGVPIRSRKNALFQIVQLLKDKQTVKISVIQ